MISKLQNNCYNYSVFFLATEIEKMVPLVALSASMTADLVVSISYLWSKPVVSLRVALCVSDYISCLASIPVLLNYEIKETDCSAGKLKHRIVLCF